MHEGENTIEKSTLGNETSIMIALSNNSHTVQNIIREVTVSPSTTTVEITVSYNDCTEPTAHNLTVMYMYYKTLLFNDPENVILSKSALFPEDDLMHKLQLTDLDPGTNYIYTISVVRTSDGETIGVPQSGTVTTRGMTSSKEGYIMYCILDQYPMKVLLCQVEVSPSLELFP